MAKNKTTETDASVQQYISNIADEQRRADVDTIVQLFSRQSGMMPKMWGPAIVGFGSYHYKYDSGHEGDAPLIGLASRTNAITLYLGSFDEKEQLLERLGKHKAGKGCVYIKKLQDVDMKVLGSMAEKALKNKKVK